MYLLGVSEIELRKNSKEVIFEDNRWEFSRVGEWHKSQVKDTHWVFSRMNKKWIMISSEINPYGNLVYDKSGIQAD